MTFGRVYNSENCEAAEHLIGKKVIGSQFIEDLNNCPDKLCVETLINIYDKEETDFVFSTEECDYLHIREVIEE